MNPGTIVFIFFVVAVFAILFFEWAVGWFFDRFVWRGVASVTVPKEDAEALLGESHKGWRLWTLRLSALVIIVGLLWAVFPGPPTATKWFGNEAVDRAIDRGVTAAENRVPGAAAHSEKLRQGLRTGAERAHDKLKPKR